MSLDADIHPPDNPRNGLQFHKYRNQYNSPWTAAADEVLREYWSSHLPVNQIGVELSKALGYTIHHSSIAKRAQKLGLPGRPATRWTDESRNLLKTLWRDASVKLADIPHFIYEATGVRFTRNACCGAANRLGMPARDKRPAGPKHGARVRIADAPKGRMQRRPPAPEYIPEPPDRDIPVEQRKTLLELERHHCRFPVGEPREPDFFFCGAQLDPNRDDSRPAYCDHHARKCLIPPRTR